MTTDPAAMPPVSTGISPRKWWTIGLLSAAVVFLVLLLIGTNASDANGFVNLVIPTYLTGLGTLALAVVTVVVTREDRTRSEALRKIAWDEQAVRLRQADARERQLQAVSVVCWPHLITPPTSDDIDRGDPDENTSGNSAHIRNGSHLPAWNVEVTFFKTTGEQTGQPRLLSVVSPGDSVVPIPWELAEEESFHVTMSFRDAASVRWMRDTVGVLTEDPDPHDRLPLPPERPGRGSVETIYADELARQAERGRPGNAHHIL